MHSWCNTECYLQGIIHFAYKINAFWELEGMHYEYEKDSNPIIFHISFFLPTKCKLINHRVYPNQVWKQININKNKQCADRKKKKDYPNEEWMNNLKRIKKDREKVEAIKRYSEKLKDIID